MPEFEKWLESVQCSYMGTSDRNRYFAVFKAGQEAERKACAKIVEDRRDAHIYKIVENELSNALEEIKGRS